MVDLVLVPGLGSDNAIWQPTVEALGSKYSCLIADTFTGATLPEIADHVLSQSPARFSLAGVSMGGMISLEIMRRAPDRVVRLALIDTNASADTEDQAAGREAMNSVMLAADDLTPLVTRGVDFMVGPNASAEVRSALIEMALRVGAARYVRQNRAVAARSDQASLLPTINVPTLVVVGADDKMTPPSFAEKIHAGIGGSDLHIIPDCGHLPPIESPEKLARLLRVWMDAGR